jgi:predicted DNA-binding WGR domain protein
MNDISSVTLFKVTPAENMHRQYTVSVGHDLFRTPLVTCRWGRIGKSGQVQVHVCRTLQQAKVLAEKLVVKRQRRGYGPTRTGVTGASVPHASRRTSPRRGRAPGVQARRAATQTSQLPLFDAVTLQATWQCKKRPQTPCERECLIEALLAPSVMQSLGKPATPIERKQAMAKLTREATLRGLSLRRGAVAFRGAGIRP